MEMDRRVEIVTSERFRWGLTGLKRPNVYRQ
jgi:hypothetical protein